MIVDGLGSSEAGGQMSHVVGRRRGDDRHVHAHARATTCCQRRPRPRARSPATTSSAGWPRAGRVPLGYLGDADKTARTYPGGRRRALRGARRPGPAAAPTASSSCTAATRSRSTPAARRSSPRRSRRRSRPTPTSTTASWPAGRASAGARRSSPSCSCATAPSADRGGAARRGRTPHRPLQAAQGVRVRRRDRALARRQGRLPLGPRGRRRRLSGQMTVGGPMKGR